MVNCQMENPNFEWVSGVGEGFFYVCFLVVNEK